MCKFIAIDADSVNIELRIIIINACRRCKIKGVFVADRVLKDVVNAKEKGIDVEMILVESGEDSADNWIVENAENQYFCISHDIGLAERLSKKNVRTLDKWGNIIDANNANERRSKRDINSYLREDGIFIKKTRPIGKKEIEKFANAFDKLLREIKKNRE